MKHQLSLDIPDTSNCKIQRITDSSKYIDDLPVTCGYLQITAPGFTSPVQIEVTQNFNIVLTACSLGLQTTECGEEQYTLPDGIYNVIYSVSPNTDVRVEYNYMRVTETLNSYYKELGRIELQGCPTEDCIKDRLRDLQEIKSYIDVAKAKVEYYNELKDGTDILKYASKKLAAYKKSCCK